MPAAPSRRADRPVPFPAFVLEDEHFEGGDRIFDALPREWKDAYEVGVFTEFMEQRAPGHTVADGKIYEKGMLDFREQARNALQKLGDSAAHKREHHVCDVHTPCEHGCALRKERLVERVGR